LSSREILSPRGVDLVQDKERDDKKLRNFLAVFFTP